MKKHFLAVFIAVFLAFVFTGCANRSPEGDESTPEAVTAITVTQGERVTIDGVCEFTVELVDITKKPEHYFEAEDGKAYADILITFQNTSDESVSAHYIAKGTLVYAGMYEYTGFTQSEEDDRSDLTNTYGRIVHASDTEYLHYLFSVPEEVQDSGNKLVLNLTICDHAYQMVVRDGAEVSDSAKEDSGDKPKTSGEIAEGEVVVVADKGEFWVDHAQVTDEVVPTKAGGAFAYYAAKEGEVFLDLVIAYKNTSPKQITVTKAVSASLELADGSGYKAVPISETGGRKTLAPDNPDIIPLETRYIHYVFSIPESAVNGETAEITIQVGKNKYQYPFTVSLPD